MMEIETMTEAAEPKPTLTTPLADCAPEKPEGKARSLTLTGNHEADSMFRGWQLADHAHDAGDGRYYHLVLHETEAGNFIAAMGFRSHNPGETSYWTVRPVETVEDVMDAFGWTVAAKRFAKALGWDIRRRLA